MPLLHSLGSVGRVWTAREETRHPPHRRAAFARGGKAAFLCALRVVRRNPCPWHIRSAKDSSLNTPCPHCGHSITPEERTHVDTDHLECPQCKKKFIPDKPEKSPAQP